MRNAFIRDVVRVQQSRKKSIRRAILPWIQSNARAVAKGNPSAPPPVGSAIYRARLARNLNALCGSTVLTAWNVGEIPDLDLYEISKYFDWTEKMKEHYSNE